MPRVSPTHFGGPRTVQTQSPFDGGYSFTSNSRVNSSQYLVGASPSHDSFSGSGFDEDEDSTTAALPSHRPWVLNEGHVISIREKYLESLGQSNRSNDQVHSQPPFAQGQSSSFHPPTFMGTGTNPTLSSNSTTIYRPTTSSDHNQAGMSHSHSFMTLASSDGGTAYPGTPATMHDLLAENHQLRSQLSDKDKHIESLQTKVDQLQRQVASLKALPVGKISQIPVE
jgi:hypothetical protein